MADDDTLPNCNCTKSLLAVQNLRSDTEDYKVQVLIIHCVLAAVVAILVLCIVLLCFWIRKLQRVVNALDPMSKYKKVGPSLYIKKVRRETSSISSSFKHFNAGVENETYSNPEDAHPSKEATLKKSEVGTLDRNFFSKTNFTFQNPSSQQNNTLEHNHSLNRRKISDPEVNAAVASLDKVIY